MIRAVGALPAIEDIARIRFAEARNSAQWQSRGGIYPDEGHTLVSIDDDSDRLAVYNAALNSYQIYSLRENVCKMGMSREDAEAWVAGRLVVVSGRQPSEKPWVVFIVVLLSSISSLLLCLLGLKLLF